MQRNEQFAIGFLTGSAIFFVLFVVVMIVTIHRADEVAASAYESGKVVGCAQK